MKMSPKLNCGLFSLGESFIKIIISNYLVFRQFLLIELQLLKTFSYNPTIKIMSML